VTRKPIGADSHICRGAAAEQLAAEYLRARGVSVLARNLRCRAGEIDLVCLDAHILAIVEVRQRARIDFGGALESVTWRKRRKILRATRFFLMRLPQWARYAVRFDVLAVQGAPEGEHDIVWIKDAFRAI
jgi:putative endonuclease